MSKEKIFVAIVFAVVIAALGLGVYYGGTPSDARDARFDNTRERALYQIGYDIDDVWATTGELPTSPELGKDPETSEPYEYIPGENGIYELCATFATDTSDEHRRDIDMRDFDSHEAGRVCFVRDATGSDKPIRKPIAE